MDDHFDVEWRQDALGLRFTPNQNDQPVVCQVPPNACAAVLASPLAVGDVLVAFDLQQSEGMQPVKAFDQLVTVLRRAKLPVTLRFQSREKEIPPKVDEADVARSYVFSWLPQSPLGVSLAMDPCSLHAAVTAIDPNKISPAFQNLMPVLGDVLVAIAPDSDNGPVTRLDEMRFEDIIQTLRQFPRPCRLTFARLAEEDSSGSDEENLLFPSRPLAPITRPKATSSSTDGGEEATDILRPPFLMRPQTRPMSRSRAGVPPPTRKLIPISKRQSFRIDKPIPDGRAHSGSTASNGGRSHAGSTASNDGRPHSGSNADDRGFYTVVYSGGAVGLTLRDCTQDDKGLTKSNDKTNRTNGYTVAIRTVTNPNSAPGLENATPDDLLMAIGQKDLQHMSFDQVRAELGAIQGPTQLLFKKRKRVTASSSGASLVDTLLLFLV
ncbi:hypothetical protein PHYSODRAFT_522285 [Phytophthora sojae]|uniref:PDZ domain-containing protein n=1 Tax=Phytophthora sojae (strain P6497) TaxID=1094619 RepID=G5A3W0_PHYSP|nr:hypothetical protein PHYSODRAFT_522285 [Phytophthora sojae]EGZ09460.1 hypothetical protein PHYSODRAFT_522285 [Phytophthora sojae]|eukprot:XP_009534321.1 hypothetical protein PHYSODRAFT_522285 [Phytophthora sojae]